MIERANPVSDENLVAYLDGELSQPERSVLEARLVADPAARSRLEHLRAGDRPFAGAFDAVLRAAPSDRLQSLLDQAVRDRREPGRGWTLLHVNRRLAAIAAAVLLFIGGVLIGVNLPGMAPKGDIEAESLDTPDGWRTAVADYLNLYTRNTLADIPDDPALREKELAFVGDKLSLPLSAGKVALPGLVLKRSQIYSLGGRPLAQIAYLPGDGGPVSLCIIVDKNGLTERPAFENRQGKNIVYWSGAGYQFMLIGGLPRSRLEPLASSLAARLT